MEKVRHFKMPLELAFKMPLQLSFELQTFPKETYVIEEVVQNVLIPSHHNPRESLLAMDKLRRDGRS